MKRVKAITIMDTVIGMVITGLVTGFAVTFYSGLTRTLINFTSSGKEAAGYEELFFVLKNDFDSHDFIMKTSEGFACLNESGNYPVYYTTSSSRVIRKQGNNTEDTIQVFIRNEKYLFEKTPLSPGFLIDEIQLDLKSEKTVSSFRWYKKYSSALIWRKKEYGH